MTTHDCPGGCGTPVARARLACRRCWYRLPEPMRDAVNTAYHSGDRLGHRRAVAAASTWYRDNPIGAAS
jgi:hypothetical protein